MTVEAKNIVCEECELRLVEAGVYQLYDMVWKQHPKTKYFNFSHAELSERKDQMMACNNCGEEIDEDIEELFDVQQTTEDGQGKYSMSLTDDELEMVQTECERCGESFADVGVFQLWDVNWMWNEKKQRFVFDSAYASELDEYAICCNNCGCPVGEDLPLEMVEVEALN